MHKSSHSLFCRSTRRPTSARAPRRSRRRGSSKRSGPSFSVSSRLAAALSSPPSLPTPSGRAPSCRSVQGCQGFNLNLNFEFEFVMREIFLNRQNHASHSLKMSWPKMALTGLSHHHWHELIENDILTGNERDPSGP